MEMEHEVNAVWKIKKETFLNLKKTSDNLEDDETIESKYFDTCLPNVRYCFALYWENKDIKIYFFQENGYCESVCVEKMELYIHSAKFQNEFDLSNSNEWSSSIAEREELLNPDNKYFVNAILELEIRGVLNYSAPSYSLTRMLWEKDDKDFKIIVGNRTIKAHKFILRQFSSILGADMNSNEIKIENFDYNVVNNAVKLCYELDFQLNSADLLKLIEFTNVYKMPLIKEQLEHKLSDLITAENVCELANKSLELKAEILRSFCVKFLSDCIKCQKTFDGTLNDLKLEIQAEVFKKSFRQTQTS